MHEELESLKESLRSGKQNFVEVASDRDRLKSLCDEKHKALQVSKICWFNTVLSTIYILGERSFHYICYGNGA